MKIIQKKCVTFESFVKLKFKHILNLDITTKFKLYTSNFGLEGT